MRTFTLNLENFTSKKIGQAVPAMLPEPVGKTGCAFATPIRIFSWFFFLCHTSPIGGVQIAGSIVLGQYKGHERIGEARTTIHRASSIVIEFAY
jgi:hypothetical protein